MRIKLFPIDSDVVKRTLVLTISVAAFLSASTGCTDARHHRRDREQSQETGVTPPETSDDSEIIRAQKKHKSRAEVTFTARVDRLLAPDTRGTQHQRFIVLLSNGTTILVAHNTDLAPEVPIQPGDTIMLHGEYKWTDEGGIVHYTHHSTNRHESGWIVFNGQRYE